MTQPSLSSAFDLFRELHTSGWSEDARWTLRRLENDERMKDAWATLSRHDREGGGGIMHWLWRIMDIKGRADDNGNLPANKSRLQMRFARLKAAADELQSFYGERDMSEYEHPDTFESVKAHNKNIRDCLTSLAWTQKYLGEMEALLLREIENGFPSSQKRDSPQTAFGVLLCRALTSKLGQPLYGFVSTVTAVAYQTNEAISEDTIRAAFLRDQRRRDSSAT